MAALVSLGFASGLPYNLTRETLTAWMTVAGVDLGTIGWFNLANLPSTVKFLWSPLLDRYVPPFLGRRRGWMLLTQLALIVAIAAMAFYQPTQALQLLAVNAIVIAFLSATQDIAIDAYRTDVLEEREVGAGVAIWVLGYRVALLVTGALALIWANRLSWQGVYLLMAALMGLGLLTSILSPEPESRDRQGNIISAPQTLRDAVQLPFQDFFARSGLWRGVLILIFILLYKVGDYLAVVMTTPFLIQTGFPIEAIGAIRGGMGLLATIVGGLLGGAVLSQIGINRSLWLFGGLQAVSNLAYFALALAGQNYPLMVAAINIENFCAGLGTAAFLGFLMSLCNPRFSATQYALLSSLVAVSREVIASPAGEIAKATGWAWFFFITFCAALPGLLLLPIFAPWNASSPSLPGDDPSDEV
ncbi:AmpG family muropeptide MFS transporter [Oscillatoria sp. FACHB-1407]|uniref:AmpG family muropeptide MFS transporter n=1 Tax=Oscillatoria sp. FACHB-1407 TaxID=2692847 RepID=UPI001682EB60|nr:AmpG family muropeptide MFS transporter [Oscillatoria sp. FACHB-1407]MBD2462143.1 AmpG family muropeptide MFS transporter [Oscillatoria sp. FACHB-1407]